MSINKVILVGNVGKDPVVRYFDKGVAKATFPLATSETYTNQQGETITSTEWHNIVLWRSLAEVAERTVKKGSQLYIVGKIKTRSYVDKDGVNKYITEILADTMLVLEKKQSSAGSGVPSEQVRNELNGKNQVNEPSGQYNTGTGRSNTVKDVPADSTHDTDSFQNNTPFPGQNEDDLPF
jgi:single-strand DNA-binding protein